MPHRPLSRRLLHSDRQRSISVNPHIRRVTGMAYCPHMETFNTIWKKYLPYMRLHRYLGQLLGSEPSVSVLRTLVRRKGKIFTIRGLAREAGVSHPSVSETVAKLESFGVVQIQPVGRSHQVTLNKKSHVLKKIVEPMLAAEEQTFDQVIRLLGGHLGTEKIVSAAVFGSAARGQEKEDSDIDVLVISNDFDGAVAAVSDAAEEIFAKFHGSISPTIFTETEFKSKNNSDLVRSILDGHAMVCGKNLRDVLK